MTRERMAPASMRKQEYDRLIEILDELRPKTTLEIGMANGGSSLVICNALRACGGTCHVAIDPFQTAEKGWGGKGVQSVREAGFADLVELVEDFDYRALPRLVQESRSFDFILIDGWHSFDYTLLDIFYSDLLLRDGGVLVVHDTGWPAVYKACRFLETHKPYDRISPPISVELRSLPARLGRRFGQLVSGANYRQEMTSRRNEWYSLGAYRKIESRQVPDNFFANF